MVRLGLRDCVWEALERKTYLAYAPVSEDEDPELGSVCGAHLSGLYVLCYGRVVCSVQDGVFWV